MLDNNLPSQPALYGLPRGPIMPATGNVPTPVEANEEAWLSWSDLSNADQPGEVLVNSSSYADSAIWVSNTLIFRAIPATNGIQGQLIEFTEDGVISSEGTPVSLSVPHGGSVVPIPALAVAPDGSVVVFLGDSLGAVVVTIGAGTAFTFGSVTTFTDPTTYGSAAVHGDYVVGFGFRTSSATITQACTYLVSGGVITQAFQTTKTSGLSADKCFGVKKDATSGAVVAQGTGANAVVYKYTINSSGVITFGGSQGPITESGTAPTGTTNVYSGFFAGEVLRLHGNINSGSGGYVASMCADCSGVEPEFYLAMPAEARNANAFSGAGDFITAISENVAVAIGPRASGAPHYRRYGAALIEWINNSFFITGGTPVAQCLSPDKSKYYFEAFNSGTITAVILRPIPIT